jgi:hypothetical protein
MAAGHRDWQRRQTPSRTSGLTFRRPRRPVPRAIGPGRDRS